MNVKFYCWMLLWAALLQFASVDTCSQSVMWYVLAQEGSVSIGENRSMDFGDPVEMESKIRLAQGGYLAVFSEQGVLAEFKSEGVYFLKGHEGRGWSEFPVEAVINTNGFVRLKDTHATGAVCAGLPTINALCDNGWFVRDDTVKLRWRGRGQEEYTVQFQDFFGDSIMGLRVKGDSLVVTPEMVRQVQPKLMRQQFMVAITSAAPIRGATEVLLGIRELPGELAWRREVSAYYPGRTAAENLLRALVLLTRQYTFAAASSFEKSVRVSGGVSVFRKINERYKRQFEVDCK